MVAGAVVGQDGAEGFADVGGDGVGAAGGEGAAAFGGAGAEGVEDGVEEGTQGLGAGGSAGERVAVRRCQRDLRGLAGAPCGAGHPTSTTIRPEWGNRRGLSESGGGPAGGSARAVALRAGLPGRVGRGGWAGAGCPCGRLCLGGLAGAGLPVRAAMPERARPGRLRRVCRGGRGRGRAGHTPRPPVGGGACGPAPFCRADPQGQPRTRRARARSSSWSTSLRRRSGMTSGSARQVCPALRLASSTAWAGNA